MRCPVCRAMNREGTECRRCKADLTFLVDLERHRRLLLDKARAQATQGEWSAMLESAKDAHQLRADEETLRYLAMGHLLTGKREYAFQLWKEQTTK